MMRTVLQFEALDSTEVKAFGDFINVIDKWRAGEVLPQGGAQTGEQQVELPQADEKIVASIDETGVTKPIKATELQAAAQAYAKKHGLDAALKIVKEFGATRVGEIKDPKMMSALYERFTK